MPCIVMYISVTNDALMNIGYWLIGLNFEISVSALLQIYNYIHKKQDVIILRKNLSVVKLLTNNGAN